MPATFYIISQWYHKSFSHTIHNSFNKNHYCLENIFIELEKGIFAIQMEYNFFFMKIQKYSLYQKNNPIVLILF